MTKAAKRKVLYTPEKERTKTQKIVRDVTFFAVVVYAAVMTFMFFNAEVEKTTAEANLMASSTTVSQFAFMR